MEQLKPLPQYETDRYSNANTLEGYTQALREIGNEYLYLNLRSSSGRISSLQYDILIANLVERRNLTIYLAASKVLKVGVAGLTGIASQVVEEFETSTSVSPFLIKQFVVKSGIATSKN